MKEQSVNHKKIFLVWPREYVLSQQLANKIDFELLLIKAKNPQASFLFRYFDQSIKTYRWLKANNPALVYIQNPPLMAVLVVYFFVCFHPKTKFLIDNHSVYFRENKWKLLRWLAKPIHKKSLLNTFHNECDIKKMSFLENALEMQFINPNYNLSKLNAPLKNQYLENSLQAAFFPILMVNRFAKDDDYQTVIAIAKKNPGWTFFITGNDRKNSILDLKKLPLNIILTGYLRHFEFLKIMKKCMLVLCLTLREKTVLWSPREAMALRKVFITSDTKILRKYYSKAGIYCKRKDLIDLREKILFAKNNLNKQKKVIKSFLIKDRNREKEQLALLKKKIKEFSTKKSA